MNSAGNAVDVGIRFIVTFCLGEGYCEQYNFKFMIQHFHSVFETRYTLMKPIEILRLQKKYFFFCKLKSEMKYISNLFSEWHQTYHEMRVPHHVLRLSKEKRNSFP